ncbi:protein Wnt-2 isoform X2 [Stigmatopora argus]
MLVCVRDERPRVLVVHEIHELGGLPPHLRRHPRSGERAAAPVPSAPASRAGHRPRRAPLALRVPAPVPPPPLELPRAGAGPQPLRTPAAASREVAFIHAISSAGAVVALARACDRGELDWCSREETVGVADAFHWGGCSQHVELAARFGRAFVDAKERKRPDARSLINLHNNKVGREVVQRLLSLQCKCHGVSGSCSVRTCWLAMADFRRTGDRLRRKYERAVHVAVNQYGAALSTVGHAAPRDNQLVYSDRSPDFCVRDHDTGSAGTAGRRCDVTSRGVDGCSVLCCGRGYDTARVSRSAKCGCQFQWCCAVRCGDCRRTEDVRTCKDHT